MDHARTERVSIPWEPVLTIVQLRENFAMDQQPEDGYDTAPCDSVEASAHLKRRDSPSISEVVEVAHDVIHEFAITVPHIDVDVGVTKVRRDALSVLDLWLDIERVGCFVLKGDGLVREGVVKDMLAFLAADGTRMIT